RAPPHGWRPGGGRRPAWLSAPRARGGPLTGVSPPHRRRIDVMLDEGYLDDLAAKPIDSVRSMHEECMEVETEISYVRRLAQARIDIVSAELERRARGGSLEDLGERLPSSLADPAPRADPAHRRLPQPPPPASDLPWQPG